MRFLIIKTSSLGDILQSFGVVEYLHQKFPDSEIDWLVEKEGYPLVQSHPLIDQAIVCNVSLLRRKKYDVVFDLQGNMKSGFWTLASLGRKKVGFGRKTVREWPNLIATNTRYEVDKGLNISLYYLDLVKQYFQDPAPFTPSPISLKISLEEQKKIKTILTSLRNDLKIMVCAGSSWPNKKVSDEALIHFLKKISEASHPFFLVVSGNDEEKRLGETLVSLFPKRGILLDRMPIPTWQHLIMGCDLVIGMDSSPLYLAATTTTPTFSIFGPTDPKIFKPLGQQHVAVMGRCPYDLRYDKQCPKLRSCPTGGCVKNLTGEYLFEILNEKKGIIALSRRCEKEKSEIKPEELHKT